MPPTSMPRLAAVVLASLGLLIGGCSTTEMNNPALATLTAVSQVSDATLAVATAVPLATFDPGDMTNPEAIAEATRRAADATAGIPDVSSLVMSQEPLATFTPSSGNRPSGRMLYIRNQRFYTADAGSGDVRQLPQDLPLVWAPPEDPGRAWPAPDGTVAFFGGADAALWLMSPDGSNARAVGGPNLPTELHTVEVTGVGSATVRLLPATDYTLVALPNSDSPTALLVDNNDRHIRGEGRLRVVHAAPGYPEGLSILINGTEIRSGVALGGTTGDLAFATGTHSLEVQDASGQRIGLFPTIALAEYELKTIFLVDGSPMGAVESIYPVVSDGTSDARVRVFNATTTTAVVTLDGQQPLVQGLAQGQIGPYSLVRVTAPRDLRQDLQLSLYGLRAGEFPVAWSPDSRRVAFLGAADGRIDLFVAEVGGQVTRVTNSTEREVNPVWSPDSRRLVWFAVDEALGAHSLYVLDQVGGSPHKVSMEPVAAAASGLAGTQPRLPSGPQWADADRFYFMPVVGASVGIWVYDVRSGDLTAVYSDPVLNVDYSPAAQAWAVLVPDPPGRVLRVELDGGSSVLVDEGGGFARWSTDGEKIAWMEGEKESVTGWRLHVMDGRGNADRVLTDALPFLQESPPVAGPDAKRLWVDGDRGIIFSRAGVDYGAGERTAGFVGTAGNDIENLWYVGVDGNSPPRRLTDLTRVFYVKEITPSPDGRSLGFVGLSYLDRTQHLWAVRLPEGDPRQVDAGVRWFMWLP